MIGKTAFYVIKTIEYILSLTYCPLLLRHLLKTELLGKAENVHDTGLLMRSFKYKHPLTWRKKMNWDFSISWGHIEMLVLRTYQIILTRKTL